MMYFYRVVYILVISWIQDCVPQLISIRAHPTTVSQGEEFAITCQSAYAQFGFKRNNNLIIQVSYGDCDIPTRDTQKYKCESKRNGIEYIIKLTVLRGEGSPQTVQWSCVHSTDNRIHSDVVNITVGNSGPTTTQETKSTTVRQPRTTTPVPTSSTASSTSSSTDPRRVNKPPSSSLPPGQPPVSSTNNIDNQPNSFNITIIATCCAVGVLVLVIIVIAVMCYKTRKQDRAKQGPFTPLAQEPVGFSAEGNYDDLDNLPVAKYDWTVGDEDFVSLNETPQGGDQPESSNPNFDASKVYGVVRKKDPVGDSKASQKEDEAEKSNPNFDPDKVYGVVDKSAKCQNPVLDSKTDNVYANQ